MIIHFASINDRGQAHKLQLTRVSSGPASGSQTVTSWSLGRRYLSLNGEGAYEQGSLTPAPIKPTNLLASNGSYFARSKPTYQTTAASSIIVATAHGISNGATGDQSSAINSLLASSVGSIVFFPAGIYLVSNTVKIPVGSRIVGEGWSQIMAAGSFFENATSPEVVVQ